ncbi:MAG: hypothetical protein V1659_03695 [Candidatus Woesearchaeota archaeon]
MDNKKLGIIIVAVSVVLLALLFYIRHNTMKSYQDEIDKYVESGVACPSDPELCPHEQRSRSQIPIFISAAIVLGIASLGLYLLFFEKSQKEIISTLERQKHMQIDGEKFDILLKGLNDDEKKVVKAVREQDGITQQTLKLRTDMHKSKLSIVLHDLEEKGIVKRVAKGKTNQVFIRIAL